MSETNNTGIASSITALFSPPVVAALRYALTALGPLFAVAGFAVMTPDRIGKIIGVVQQVGLAVAAITAFAGIVGPLLASAYGTFKSTQGQQVKSAAVIATGPKSDMTVAAQQAIIAGTNAIAQDCSIPTSQEAKVALLDAVTSQKEVVGKINVTDQTLVDASKSGQVQKARAP